jgi:uncharacterized membrane protein YdjX (TVP38/TMEM64 family)
VTETPRRLLIFKLVAAAVLLAGFFVLLRVLPINQWLLQFQAYVRESGALGYVLYVLMYVLCCVLLIPAFILTLGAGAIFGFVKGSIIVVIGATLGATAAFLLARTVLRRRVETMAAGNPKFKALDRAIAREGAKIVLLIRLAPIFPFTWVNFVFGLTGIRTSHYILATFLGILPVTMAFVYASSAAADAVTQTMSTTRLVINIAGAACAVVATVVVARIAMTAVRRAGLDE